jgi:hypoxanthine phosphoribosyltransferase
MKLWKRKDEIQLKIRKETLLIEGCIGSNSLDILAFVILNGGYMYATDLLREFLCPQNFQIEFIKSKSYNSTKQNEKVNIDFCFDPKNIDFNKRILLIDDIHDTGKTIFNIKNKLKEYTDKKIYTTTLVYKNHPDIKKYDTIPDFYCFKYSGLDFLIGYGMNNPNDKCRAYNDLYLLEKEEI